MPRTPFLLAACLVVALAAPAVAQPNGRGGLEPEAADDGLEPARFAGRKVALLVGVGTFQHGLPDLHGSPQKDVAALARVLKAGGFAVESLTDAEATKAHTERRFRAALAGDGKPLGPTDLLVVAVCTHGFSLPPTAGQPAAPFLAAHDSALNRADTMIGLTALIDVGRSSGATVLYLLDACRELPPGAGRGLEAAPMALPRGTAVLFGCDRGQVSHQSDKADGHGLFTYAVLKTLRGENGLAGDVSWAELVAAVQRLFRTPEFAALAPPRRPQTPFAATGEMAYTELLCIGGELADDYNAFRSAGGRYLPRTEPDRIEYLRTAAPTRLPAWRAKAEKGDVVGQLLYGYCLHYGVGVVQDDVAAARWFRKAAEAGNPTAMRIVAKNHATGLGVAKDEAEAVKWFTKTSEAGYAIGLYELGRMYEDGQTGTPNAAEAVKWYLQAADAGNRPAMFGLARVYDATNDDAKAMKWHLKLAEVGVQREMYTVAKRYEVGRGVRKNEAKAAAWYRKSADAGNKHALATLGQMYETGRGVKQDYAEAIALYRQAARAEDASGMLQLGWMYMKGLGTAQNETKGVQWFQKSADTGRAGAMASLGWAYEYGKGVPKDAAKAVEWYRKAVANGNDGSKEGLKRLGAK